MRKCSKAGCDRPVCAKGLCRNHYTASGARRRNQKKRAESRAAAIGALGVICECCGETTLEFLTIDHRFGGGCRHRNSVNPSKMYLYYRSILHDPEREKKYRVLCMNCNWAIGRYGECPHQKERPSLRKAEVYLICSPQDLRNAADVIEAKANPLDPNSPNSRAEIATPSLTMTFLNQDSPDVKAACDQAEMQRRTKGGIIVPQGVVGPVQ